MSINTARRKEIADLVRFHGFVSIEPLAQQFRVTPQTIRRDINELCEQGVLQRIHGGAKLPSSTENIAYPERKYVCREEKFKIAALVAKHIPHQASLFINIGTTNEAIAEALLNHRGLSVITNNLNVATVLSSKADFKVMIAGGEVRHHDRGIVGEATIDMIRQFKMDIGMIGISAIDADGALLDFDEREVQVARAIMENSRQVFLAADHTKFRRNAMARLTTIDHVDAFFTDRSPPQSIIDLLSVAEKALHIVGDHIPKRS